MNFKSAQSILLIITLYSNCYCIGGKNKFDKQGQRHGRWITYHDSTKTTAVSKGRYRHGKECRTWKYYTHEGIVYKKEKYRRKNNTIVTTFYHPNGKIQSKGIAKMVEETDGTHYYWEGEWEYYSQEGKPIKTVLYKEGKQVGITKY